jgi:hypothetical protein
MIISYDILREFISEKFPSLVCIRITDYYFFDVSADSMIHIVFDGSVDYYEYDSFGEDVLLSDFKDWLSRRRSVRLGD